MDVLFCCVRGAGRTQQQEKTEGGRKMQPGVLFLAMEEKTFCNWWMCKDCRKYYPSDTFSLSVIEARIRAHLDGPIILLCPYCSNRGNPEYRIIRETKRLYHVEWKKPFTFDGKFFNGSWVCLENFKTRREAKIFLVKIRLGLLDETGHEPKTNGGV